MSRIISDKEYEAVRGLPSSERYKHFVKHVADTETVWSLCSAAGWVLMADPAGAEVIPLWPAERYAIDCAVDEFDGANPQSIPLDEFIEKWIPGMTKDGRLAGVFPTSSASAIVVDPARLKDDLDEELENYE